MIIISLSSIYNIYIPTINVIYYNKDHHDSDIVEYYYIDKKTNKKVIVDKDGKKIVAVNIPDVKKEE